MGWLESTEYNSRARIEPTKIHVIHAIYFPLLPSNQHYISKPNIFKGKGEIDENSSIGNQPRSTTRSK